MKKVLFIMLTLASTLVMAVNDVTLVANATVHSGAAAGDPLGFIDGTGKLDVSGMPDGSLIVFDVIMTDLDFTLAGFEFAIDYPVNLTALSLDPAEWEAGATSSAIFIGAGLTDTASTQWLPADSAGLRTASTVVNFDGTYRVGMLWTDAGLRPVGTPGAMLTDRIGQISFILDGRDNCTSLTETITATLTAADPAFVPKADIFAAADATRVILGTTANAVVSFGEPGLFIRADGNGDGVRNALDLLSAAYCSIAGQSDSICNSEYTWSGESAAAFLQTFDYNCDGVVNAIDLLGNALMTVGQANRSVAKNTEHIAMNSTEGTVVFGFGKVNAGMGFASLAYDNMKLDVPTISEEAEQQGWSLIYDLEADTMNLAVFNMKGFNTNVPKITMSYQTNGNGSFALLDSFIKDKNMETLSVDLQLNDNMSVIKSTKPVEIKTVK